MYPNYFMGRSSNKSQYWVICRITVTSEDASILIQAEKSAKLRRMHIHSPLLLCKGQLLLDPSIQGLIPSEQNKVHRRLVQCQRTSPVFDV